MITIIYNQLKSLIPTLPEIENVKETEYLSNLGLKEENYEAFQNQLYQSLGLPSSVNLSPFFKQGTLETLGNVLKAMKQIMESPIKNPKYEELIQVAVIGIGLRLPGGINTLDKYWKTLINGRNCVAPTPTNRHLHHNITTAEHLKPGEHYITKFAYYDSTSDVAHPTEFDPLFFGINPNDASVLDFKFRWIYETVYEALQDAGINPDNLSGSNTNVYVAPGQTDEINRLTVECSPTGYSCVNGNSMHNCAQASCPGRISFLYNLRGSANIVDTACSSGLIATNNAFKDLTIGETDLAIVSAAHMSFLSDAFSLLSVAQMVSRNCRCAAYDAAADGYVPGEGCVTVLLKRFDDAVRDNNKIYGLINATAAGQSGARVSMSSPSDVCQTRVHKLALSRAKVTPKDIDYVEGHGTGTALGDRIEGQAINNVFSGSHNEERPLVLASVKTNFGHTEEVSGLASLVKVMLAMKNKTIPPHLHFNKPNPMIDFESTPLHIPTHVEDWNPVEGKKRTALVSSYGLQGSICDAVVEEYIPPEKEVYGINDTYHILTISAKSHAALIASAEQYISLLETIDENGPIADLCYTSNIGRQHMKYRYAVVGKNSVELLNELNNFVNQGKKVARTDRREIGMSFTGQGNAKPGIGKELFDTQPVFRQAMEKCDEVVKKLTGISMLDALYKAGQGHHLKKAQIAQPVLFAYEYAMSMLWKSWGIQPTIVNGHSLGEIVAATVAGALDFDLAIEFIIERARCMGEYGEKPGAMASVFEKESVIKNAIEEFGYEDDVAIAAINGVTHTVISGREEELEDITEYFNQMGIKTKKLDVTDAFHSSLMEPAVEELNQWIEAKDDQQFRKAFTMKFISNVDGNIKEAGARLDQDYWSKHALQSVRFTDGVQSLVKNESKILAVIEVGPAATLTNMSSRFIRETPELQKQSPYFIASSVVGQNNEQSVYGAIAKLYMYGGNIDWSVFHKARVDATTGKAIPVNLYDLPLYPFQRSRYWLETEEECLKPLGSETRKSKNWDRYKAITVIEGDKGNIIVSAPLGQEYVKYLAKNHVIMGNGCVPAAAYTQFIFDAMKAINKDDEVYEIMDELLVRNPLNITETSDVDFIMKKHNDSVRVFTKLDGGEESLMLNATVIYLKDSENPNVIDEVLKPEEVKALASRLMTKENTHPGSEIYKSIIKKTQYGAGFISVQSTAIGKDDESNTMIARISSNDKSENHIRNGINQVYLFDACLHSNICQELQVFSEEENKKDDNASSSFLPSSFENIIKYKPIPDECYVVHKTIEVDDKNSKFTTFSIFDLDGNVCIHVGTFQTRKVKFDNSIDENPSFELYSLHYRETALIQELLEFPSMLIIRDHQGYADAYIKFLNEKSQDIKYLVVEMPETAKGPMDEFVSKSLDAINIKPESKGYLAVVNFMAMDYADFDPRNVDGRDPEFKANVRRIYESNLMFAQAFVRIVDDFNCKSIICNVTKQASDFWKGEVDLLQGIMSAVSKSVWKEFLNIRTFNLDVCRQANPDKVSKQAMDEIMSSVNRFNVSLEVVYDKEEKRYQSFVDKEKPKKVNLSGFGDRHYHGTIMITGGFGGVGTDATNYLITQPDITGLILTGRRPETDEKVAQSLARLREANPKIKYVYSTVNVGSDEEMKALFDSIPKLGLEPLTGIIHTAGANDDGMILNQTYEKFEKLMNSKIDGSLCLTRVTQGMNLEFTVLFSSVAAFFGNRGQINYVTVNMFVNKMALYYRNHGRNDIISLQLAGWPSGLSFTAKDRTMDLNPINSMNLLTNIISHPEEIPPIVLGAPVLAWANITDSTIHDPAFRKFRPVDRPMKDLNTVNDSAYIANAHEMNEKVKVRTAEDDNDLDNEEINESNVYEIMERELKKALQYNDDDEIDPYQSLPELGIDSIMMMEVRTIFRNVTSVNIPLVLFSTQNICLHRLVEYVKTKLVKESKKEEEVVINEEERKQQEEEARQLAKEESELISNDEIDQWIRLVNTEDIEEEPLNVFIKFPSADEGETDFEEWTEEMEDSLFFTIQLPGYGERKDMELISDWDILSKNIAKVIVNCYETNKFKDCSNIHFIGQSFGALLAWKTLLQIQILEDAEKNVPIISTLVISRAIAPSAPHPITIELDGQSVVFSELSNEDLAKVQAKMGNSVDFSDEDLAYLLPVLHNEYVMMDSLTVSDDEKLKIRSKLLMLTGKQDKIISEGNASLWKKEVSDGFKEFIQQIKMKGDHWFAQKSLNKFLNNIMENLD